MESGWPGQVVGAVFLCISIKHETKIFICLSVVTLSMIALMMVATIVFVMPIMCTCVSMSMSRHVVVTVIPPLKIYLTMYRYILI